MPRLVLAQLALMATAMIAPAQPPAAKSPEPVAPPPKSGSVAAPGVSPATRAAVVSGLKKAYPAAVDAVKVQLAKAKTGRVSPAARLPRIVPPGKGPNTYKTAQAKAAHVAELEKLLDDLAADPTLAATPIPSPVGPYDAGRLSPFLVLKASEDRVLAMLSNATGRAGGERPVVIACDAVKMLDGQVHTLPGLYYAAEATPVSYTSPNAAQPVEFRSYVLRPLPLTADEVRQITGAPSP